MRRRAFLTGIATLMIAAACSTETATTTTTPPTAEPTSVSERPVPWPTAGWETATPEEVGMDSEVLTDLIDHIVSTDLDVDSVTVVRDGRMVLNAVFYPFPDDRRHIIHSDTKSIVSTLIGIAIEEGLIEGVGTPVVEVLSDDAPSVIDPRLADMTVEDVLTMSTGLDCQDSYLYGWTGLRAMRASGDWAAHVLGLPLVADPGTRFEYCNGGSYLLSAMITEVTGGPALEFARDHLFGPLGITDVAWVENAEGVNHGWGDMHLLPEDMAKIGYLILRDGEWDGEQIVPATWVADATTASIAAGTLSDSYGYQWWIDDDGYVMAVGFAGQYIFIDEANDLVASFTSGVGNRFAEPERLFASHIRGAIVGDEPLPADPDTVASLEAAVAVAGHGPDPIDLGEMPPIVEDIDGVTYDLETNSGGFEWLRLGFEGDTLTMELEDVDGPIEVTSTFDGRFHESEAWTHPWSWNPHWENEDTLIIEFQVLGGVLRGHMEFSFDGDEVSFRYWERVQGTDVRARGRVRG